MINSFNCGALLLNICEGKILLGWTPSRWQNTCLLPFFCQLPNPASSMALTFLSLFVLCSEDHTTYPSLFSCCLEIVPWGKDFFLSHASCTPKWSLDSWHSTLANASWEPGSFIFSILSRLFIEKSFVATVWDWWRAYESWEEASWNVQPLLLRSLN